tara:strand:+ start:4577 stop:5353 length:777 start_codon:yes stop_codon:yes gene_type:complete
MFRIQDLTDSLNRNDPFSFLLVYLNLIVQGSSLSLPTQSKINFVKDEWASLMPPSCQNFTDSFLLELSQIWIKLVDSHSGIMSDFYVSELLDILTSEPQVKSLVSVAEDGPLIGMNPKLNSIESSISSDYKLEQNILNQEEINNKHTLDQLLTFYSNQDAISFLNYYLEFCLQNDQFNYPQSSLLESIEDAWTSIFSELYKKKPNEQFIKDISFIWFHFVNKYSIPYVKTELETIIFYYRKKYFKNIKTIKPSKKGNV